MRTIYKIISPYSDKGDDSDLTALQENVSTLLHHNAITGTEREDVASSYKYKILQSIEKAEDRAGEIIG